MLLPTSSEMRKIDDLTINKYKTPGLLLMENAGKALADEAYELGESFAVICGKGNNGGDGSVSARHLFTMEKNVSLIFLAEESEIKNDALKMLEIAKEMGVKAFFGFNDKTRKIIENSDVLIDAILGTGLNSAPKGIIADVINFINEQNKPIISADIPTGLNADNGVIYYPCVKALKTVTFGFLKTGMALCPARDYCGEVIIKKIGFSPKAVSRVNIKTQLIDEIKLSKIPNNYHKGNFGKVLTIAGSVGMSGAAILSAGASIKSGASIVTLSLPSSLNIVAENKLTEVMSYPLPDENGVISEKAIDEILKLSEKYDTIVFGCGISRNNSISKILKELILKTDKSIVIDADGIFALSKIKNVLKEERKSKIIITPHIGEMEIFTSIPKEEIINNSISVAKNVSLEYNIIVVLKSAHTIIAQNEEIYIISNPCSALATAGSGDVLSGIIGGFVANEDEIINGVINGVFIHNKAGIIASGEKGIRATTATDILNSISKAIKEFE